MPVSLVCRYSGSPRAQRLAGGAFANFLGKAWALLIQLVSIPVLTIHWGLDGYGAWLLLTTIPAYVAIADLGLTTAAGTALSMKVAAGDNEGALAIFQSAFAVLVALFVAATSLAALAGVACGALLGDPALGACLALMTVFTALSLLCQLAYSVYRATHRYILGTVFLDSLILVDGAVVVTTAMLGGGPTHAAAALVLCRAIGLAAYYIVLKRREPWVRLGWSHASLPVIQRLVRPSMSAFSLVVSSALSLQGVILAIGWAAGTSAVAVFGAARLITRIPLQLAGLVTRASMPELTRAQVAGHATPARRLLVANVAFAFLSTAPFVLVLTLFGPHLLQAISGGSLHAPPMLFLFLSVAAMFSAGWTAAASPLVAVNQYRAFVPWYLAASVATVAVPVIFGTGAVIPAAAAMAVAEATTFALVASRLSQAVFLVAAP